MYLQRIAEDGEDDDADSAKADKEAGARVHGDDVVADVATKAEVAEHAYDQVHHTTRANRRPDGGVDSALDVVEELVVDGKHVLRACECKYEHRKDADGVPGDIDELDISLG